MPRHRSFQPAALPANEADRLRRLRALSILDSAAEPLFDALTAAAAELCGTPVALVSLVDEHRQWFKSAVGLGDVTETPRDVAFCAHAILGDGLFEVADARKDPRFAANPLVTGPANVRFYAGAPIALSDGSALGTLCVIDHVPNALSPTQRSVLQQLATVAARALEQRQVTMEALARAALVEQRVDSDDDSSSAGVQLRRDVAEALRADWIFLDRVGKVAGVAGWSLDFRTEQLTWSEQTRRLHDVDAHYEPTLASAVAFCEPQARLDLMQAIRDALEGGTSFDLELAAVSATGRALWMRAVASVEFEDGRPRRLVGAYQDITERKLLECDLASDRDLLQDTLDSIGNAVITADNDGTILWMNPMAESLTGWSKAEAVGRPLAGVFDVVDERTRQGRPDLLEHPTQPRSDLGTTPRVLTLISRCGTEYGIEDSTAAIRHADGRVQGTVHVFHDVSEQRRANSEMSHRATHDP